MALSHASASRESDAAERVGVVLPLPLEHAYDYAANGLDCPPGTYVVVPLGKREVVGVAWDGGDGAVPVERLKPVVERIGVPPMTAPLRRLVEWIAGYTVTPLGAVLRMAMSVPSAFDAPRTVTTYVANPRMPPPQRLTAARRAVLDLLADGRARTAPEITRATGSGAGVVRGLASLGVVEVVEAAEEATFPVPDWR
ncbi:MAG: primosomal protein N', partial [Rhodospirillales bacterium]